MENFIFQSPTKFILEEEAVQLVGQETANVSKNVLLIHYGDDFIRSSGLRDIVVDSLKKAGVQYEELTGITPNPSIEKVYDGVQICKEKNIGCLLALGGGSVIDTAKAIAIGAMYDGDAWDFFTGAAQVEKALPIGVVMTLSATGSEGSNGSVISKGTEKRDVMSDLIRPNFVIMSPELTQNTPMKQTVCGIADMFSHVTERYFSSSVNTEFTDRLCEGVMKSIIVNAKILLKDPSNYDARADLMWTSIIAHNGLLGTGRNQDWATHMIGAPLSGEYDAVHGETISVLLPVWALEVYDANIKRFAQFANRVFGIDYDFYDEHERHTAIEGIVALRGFFNQLGLPSTLKEIGITTDEKFEKMAKEACRYGSVGGLKVLYQSDVENIYRKALH